MEPANFGSFNGVLGSGNELFVNSSFSFSMPLLASFPSSFVSLEKIDLYTTYKTMSFLGQTVFGTDLPVPNTGSTAKSLELLLVLAFYLLYNISFKTFSKNTPPDLSGIAPISSWMLEQSLEPLIGLYLLDTVNSLKDVTKD